MSAQSPTLTAVRYDGVTVVGLQWEPVDGAINFLTAVFDGDGRIVAQGTGFGVQGSVRLASPLTSGSYHAAAAVKTDGQPVWGSTLPLVLERLRTLTASYADGTTVDASWSFPDGSFPNGATLVALDTSTGGELGQAVIFADAGKLTLTGPLDPAAPASRYVLQGGATLGGSVGPPVSTPLLATPARLRGLEYDPAGPLLDAFLDQPVPDGGRAGLALYAGDRLVQEAIAPTPSMAVQLRVAAPLDPATAWSARPFWTVQGSRGPYGDPLAVVVEAPRIRDVRWDAGSLVVTWENAPGPPYPTGAQVEVKNGGRVWCGFVSTDPTSARFPPDPALQPLSAYTVTVAALHGGSQGPPSAEAPVVVGRSALGSAAYDGRAVRASWSDSPPIAAREARLLVRAGELVVAEVGAIARQAAVDVALAPGGLYTASLVWVNAPTGSRGPEGPRTPLVTGAALLATAAVDGGNVTLAWSDPPDDARTVSGLQAVFSSPGFPPRTTPLTRAQPTVAITPPSSDPLVPVSVAVQALGSSTAGPLSGALPLLRDAPAVTRVALGDDGALHVDWTPLAGAVGSYLVAVTKDGAALASADVPADRTGALLPLGAVAPSAAYAVTVVARAGGARGPLPAATRAIATAPTLGAAAFDGTTVTVALTAPVGGGPAPDRYELELLRDGAVVQRATVAAPAAGAPLALAVAPALDRDGRFALAVRAGGGAALGPAAATAVLLAAPRVEQVACDGATIVATVAPGAQPRDGLTLTAALSVDGVEQQTRAVDGDGRATFAVPVSGRVTIAARGQRGGASGPWSEPVTALRSRPALASVRCDDGRVTVAWTPPGPAEAALLTAGGAVVASARVDGELAVLEPPAGVAPPLSVRVVPRGERASGPAATSAALTVAPVVQQVLSDPLTGAATVSFSAITGPPAASGYDVQLLRDGAPHGDPVQTATTTARLPSLAGLFDLAVTVRARGGGGGGEPALTGPYGAALPLLTHAPAAVTADFDGLTVLARWRPVAGATGHRVAVVADGRAEPIAQADAPAGADALRLAVRLPDTTSAWQLAVQPLLGASSGPPAHAPLFAPGLYLRSDGQPRIFRAASPALQPQAQSAYLPQIGPLTSVPLPDLPADAPLRIVANDDGASRAAFPYRLAIGGAALDFSSGEPIRAAVWSASETLLARAEAAGATPWGIVQLQQAISRLLPQTFAETLLYAYGLSPTTGSADLRPGMVLRVAAGGFELMPSNRPPAWAQGYAGGAAADYEIADYLDATPQPADAPWLLGFDGYLSWLCANGALTVPAPQQESMLQSGAADAADLYWPLFRQPFYRLFAPVELQAATPPAVAQTRQQFTLAAAATHRLISGAGPAASPGVAVAYFRGRAVARLLIRVVVDGETQLVPIGTTVGNVLDRFARRPPRAATALRGLALERSNGPLVLDPSAYAAGGGMPVGLGYGGLATFDRRDALSLPLLHGDRLTLGEAAR